MHICYFFLSLPVSTVLTRPFFRWIRLSVQIQALRRDHSWSIPLHENQKRGFHGLLRTFYEREQPFLGYGKAWQTTLGRAERPQSTMMLLLPIPLTLEAT
ncbi:hypothetical protein C8R45DRAFT_441336 [Mycena sanguinolenta]|nr:hypothetical protein C8R45DRAFT_441336 [Mycena sanguinolenta]